jgi:hypothetical protein
LHNFDCTGMDGANPVNNNGTVFRLTPGTNGNWALSTLFAFDFSDGSDSLGGLVLDGYGNVWHDLLRGAGGEGTVFEITP